MANKGSFALQITQLAKKSQADLDLVVRKATFELFSKIVLRSPVGNPSLWASKPPKGYVGGRFRANWNVSVGTPDTTTTESTRQSRGSQQAAKALNIPAGQVVFMSNGLPYAQRLENGWSTQAPIGMVRVSLTEFQRQLKTILRTKRV